MKDLEFSELQHSAIFLLQVIRSDSFGRRQKIKREKVINLEFNR